MSAIWLACCAADEYRGVQREILARDEGAQLLRMSDLGEVRRMTRALPAGGASVALVDSGDESSAVRDVVAGIASDGHAREIVVVARVLDPGRIALLFAAGATEVVAAEQGSAAPSEDGARVEERSCLRSASTLPSSAAAPAAVSAAGDAQPDPAPPAARSAQEGGDGPAPGPGDVSARGASAFQPEAPEPEKAPEPAPKNAPVRIIEGRPDPPGSPRPAAAGPPGRWGSSAGGEGEAQHAAAPVVTVISGRGGTGKTTLLAGIACCAAQWGLRAAVVDADLMFGNLHRLVGCDAAPDLALVANEPAPLEKAALARSALLVAPGLTVWGPCGLPETAELVAPRMGDLLQALAREADVVLVDTASPWGDAVSEAVARSERCLVAADLRAGMIPATKRVIELAAKLGVPRTKMVCVANRFEGRSPVEEFALRLEMEAGLAAKTRVAAASGEAAELMRLGRLGEVLKRREPFAEDVRKFARLLLRELGCVIAPPPETAPADAARRKFKLPWKEETRP